MGVMVGDGFSGRPSTAAGAADDRACCHLDLARASLEMVTRSTIPNGCSLDPVLAPVIEFNRGEDPIGEIFWLSTII